VRSYLDSRGGSRQNVLDVLRGREYGGGQRDQRGVLGHLRGSRIFDPLRAAVNIQRAFRRRRHGRFLNFAIPFGRARRMHAHHLAATTPLRYEQGIDLFGFPDHGERAAMMDLMIHQNLEEAQIAEYEAENEIMLK